MEPEGQAMKDVKLVWDRPSLTLLVKLGSLIVHADEAFGVDGRQLDVDVFKHAMKDQEVQAWIKEGVGMSFLPRKRKL